MRYLILVLISIGNPPTSSNTTTRRHPSFFPIPPSDLKCLPMDFDKRWFPDNILNLKQKFFSLKVKINLPSKFAGRA